jgi:hypothetical protein
MRESEKLKVKREKKVLDLIFPEIYFFDQLNSLVHFFTFYFLLFTLKNLKSFVHFFTFYFLLFPFFLPIRAASGVEG